MIAVDTNVLLRLFLVEDLPQSEQARAFFATRSERDPAFVPLVVMAEFAWVLKRRYKFPFDRIRDAIRAILDSPDFVVDQREIVEQSADRFDRQRLDFSDLLISRSALAAGCAKIITFDHDAAGLISEMELLR